MDYILALLTWAIVFIVPTVIVIALVAKPDTSVRRTAVRPDEGHEDQAADHVS